MGGARLVLPSGAEPHYLVLVTHCLRPLVSLEARMRRGRRLVLGPLSPRLSLVAPPFVHRPRTVAWAPRARLRKEEEGWKKWKQDMSGATCRKIGSPFKFLRQARPSPARPPAQGPPQRAIAGASLPLVIVNPAQVRHFAQALGHRAKTDPIDASMIARFVEATKPDLRPLADEATQLLADLVARRRQIIEMIVAERNREKRVAVRRIRKSIARLIAALDKELSEIDGEIDASVRGSPAWREKEDLLASVPGVGPITARTLIAELPELGTLDGKRIASLAGLAPFTRQSGQWEGKAMIAGGRKSVRSALFLASLVACRHNSVLKAFRQRLIDAGKPKMLSAIAAARKLLTILNAILRDKQPWRPESA